MKIFTLYQRIFLSINVYVDIHKEHIMKKFCISQLSQSKEITISDMIKNFNISYKDAEKLYEETFGDCQFWTNDMYQVNIRKGSNTQYWFHFNADNINQYVYLSIKRRDKEAAFDLEHLQEIKDVLVGENLMAIELYPNQKRVLDTANQYHMFVFPENIFPVKFTEDLKSEDADETYHTSNKKVYVYRQEDTSCVIKFRYNTNKNTRDWREIQDLKNKIAGADREAFLIFPHKDFVRDKNFNYLIVTPENIMLPFGDMRGGITQTAGHENAKQRAFAT